MNRVEVDVVHQTQKRTILPNQVRFIAALEDMATLTPKTVSTCGKGALQPLHADDQIRIRCFYRQVVMIAHALSGKAKGYD